MLLCFTSGSKTELLAVPHKTIRIRQPREFIQMRLVQISFFILSFYMMSRTWQMCITPRSQGFILQLTFCTSSNIILSKIVEVLSISLTSAAERQRSLVLRKLASQPCSNCSFQTYPVTFFI